MAALIVSVGFAAAEPRGERIVGGDVADAADWQFIAELTTVLDEHICGASVVSPTAIVTAAHCVSGESPATMRVVTGRTDRSAPGGQTHTVSEITTHPQWMSRGRHDVAVLRILEPTSATPIQLPSRPDDEQITGPGDRLRVAGWGSTKPAGTPATNRLRDASTRAIESEPCERGFPRFRAELEVCTAGREYRGGHVTACYGDSGGPLVADTPSGPLLVGAVSYGPRRCGEGKPTVFARMAANLGFIRREAGLP